MADINSAFGSAFCNSCSLTFDIAPILSPTVFGEMTTKWMGIVTMHSLVGTLQEYRYEVFSNESEKTYQLPISGLPMSGRVPSQFFQVEQPSRKVVTRGTITNSNNMSFTFPIASTQIDYFVLVSPLFKSAGHTFPPTQPRAPLTSQSYDLRDLGGLHGGTMGSSRESCEMYAESNSSPNTVGPSSERTQEFGIFYTSKLIKKRNEAMRKAKQSKEEKCDVSQPVCSANEPCIRQRKIEVADTPIGSNNIFEVPEFSSPSDFEDAMSDEKKQSFLVHCSAEREKKI